MFGLLIFILCVILLRALRPYDIKRPRKERGQWSRIGFAPAAHGGSLGGKRKKLGGKSSKEDDGILEPTGGTSFRGSD